MIAGITGLAVRSDREEQMDAAELPDADYAAVLRDLGRVNRWTMTARPTIAFLKRVLAPGQRFSLIDVGYGDGDILRTIARWAVIHGHAANLVGVDLNPRSEPVARAATPDGMTIEWRTGDYVDQREHFDFWISSQVAHHMTPDQLKAFLKHMEAEARRGWIVSDLHRHWIAYLGFPLLARLLGVHRIVREDGTLSIARSFRPGEWRDILGDAGIAAVAARIRWYIPFRLCVERLH